MDKKIFLLPGELFVSREPVEIDTLLGSCVAICLFNRKQCFGGMNHFMLSHPPLGTVASGKHGDYSSKILIQKMLSFDQNTQNLEAFVLGGGNVTGHLSIGAGIGAKNIILAKQILEEYRIKITHKDIGGILGRKVYFKNWNGEIIVKKIEKSIQSRAIEQKRMDLAKRRIKVLIVDDSALIRSIITEAISIDPQIEVVGQAENPYVAREIMLEKDPDVLCLDIIMPKMDGITFLKKLFLYKPKPVIIISTVAQKGSKLREQAQRIGAVDVIDKEDLELYNGMDVVRSALINKIKAASKVWVQKKTKEELAK
ncbi:MAG: hypothetical protein DRP78_03810 [Candidatus Omnitrophota bacterium]|nr:MAG: hypothetical protein DRP78_03810 [Candidatus Omnitrophota bacterium]